VNSPAQRIPEHPHFGSGEPGALVVVGSNPTGPTISR